MTIGTISNKPWDWDNWVWNPQYKGAMAETTKTKVVAERIYEDNVGTVVMVYQDAQGNLERYLFTSPKSKEPEDASILRVNDYHNLIGKTLEAYVSGTTIVAIRNSNPPSRQEFDPNAWHTGI